MNFRSSFFSTRRFRPICAAILLTAFFLPWLSIQDTLATDSMEFRQPIIHIVMWGETLYSIGLRYEVEVQSIVDANDLQDEKIFAGQELVIPGASRSARVIGSGQMHLVASGETLYGISVRYGITETELASANNLRDRDTIFVGQEVIIPISTVDSQTTEVSRSVTNIGNHVVQAGETLFSIASRYGVSPNSIVASNGLINPAHIEAGQTLIIPGSGGTTNIGYTPSQNVRRHTVHRGETLTSIAASYGVSVWTLATVNNLSSLSILYVDQELSIPGQSTLLSPSTVSDKNTRQIIVDISDQRTYVYSDGRLLWSFVSSTGVAGADTWRGNFTILNKIQRAYAATWNLEMPNWLGFYWAGSLQNGFHALPILWNGQRLWEGLLGQPASYGCVILSQEDSQTLYDWALVGDAVVVQD